MRAARRDAVSRRSASKPAGDRASPTKVFVKSTSNPFGFDVGPHVPYDGVAGEKAMLAFNVAAFARIPQWVLRSTKHCGSIGWARSRS
jgi:hypothetical protein